MPRCRSRHGAPAASHGGCAPPCLGGCRKHLPGELGTELFTQHAVKISHDYTNLKKPEQGCFVCFVRCLALLEALPLDSANAWLLPGDIRSTALAQRLAKEPSSPSLLVQQFLSQLPHSVFILQSEGKPTCRACAGDPPAPPAANVNSSLTSWAHKSPRPAPRSAVLVFLGFHRCRKQSGFTLNTGRSKTLHPSQERCWEQQGGQQQGRSREPSARGLQQQRLDPDVPASRDFHACGLPRTTRGC